MTKLHHEPPAIRVEIRDPDHEALLSIKELLDGVEWNADTLDAIAGVMMRAGYPIRDLHAERLDRLRGQ